MMQPPPQGPPWQGSPQNGVPPQDLAQQGQPQPHQDYPQQQGYAQPPQQGYPQQGRVPGQTPLPMRQRVDLAVRGCLFLVTIALAFILAIATPLGHAIDLLQAGGPGGTYSPKLTLLTVIVITAVPMVVVYFVFGLLVIDRLSDK